MTRAQFKAYQRLLKVVPLTIEGSFTTVEVSITDEPDAWEEIEDWPAYRLAEVFPADAPSEMCPDWDDLDVDTDLLEAWPGLAEAYIYSYNLGAEFAAADAYTRRAEQGFCNY